MAAIGDDIQATNNFLGLLRQRDLPVLLFFFACLIPVNVANLSVNYLFVLYPIWGLVSGKSLRYPPRELVGALGWYILIFVAGVVAGIWSGTGIEWRSISSFLIFSSMFALIFIDLTARELALFKMAVLAAALFFALTTMVGFFWAGGNAVGFAQKDIVGSQRYGFVYLAAFFVVLSKRSGPGLTLAPKLVVVGILLAGMLLTFSRSTILTFVATAAVYVLMTALETRRNLRGGTQEVARRFGLVISCLCVLFLVIPLPFNFYNHQILARYVPVLEYLAEAPSTKPVNAPATNPATSATNAANTSATVPANTSTTVPANTSATVPANASATNPTNTSAISTSETPLPPEQMEIVNDVFNKVGSEGTRMVLWSLIFDYVNQHPILGSRYLGTWTLEGAPTGSAHNQLFDVLLRTGWPGLAIYVLLIIRLLFCLYRVDRGLFWGLVSTLIFGTFHETFKESQGAFMLAFIMGVLATTAGTGLSAPGSGKSPGHA